MESNVESDSQLFWNEKEKDEYQGMYTHPNVIREVLSDPEGDPINAGGSVLKEYQTELDPMWNAENLYLVAFIHRDGELGGRHMHVFNSAMGDITDRSDYAGILPQSKQQIAEGHLYY